MYIETLTSTHLHTSQRAMDKAGSPVDPADTSESLRNLKAIANVLRHRAEHEWPGLDGIKASAKNRKPPYSMPRPDINVAVYNPELWRQLDLEFVKTYSPPEGYVVDQWIHDLGGFYSQPRPDLITENEAIVRYCPLKRNIDLGHQTPNGIMSRLLSMYKCPCDEPACADILKEFWIKKKQLQYNKELHDSIEHVICKHK